MDTDGQIPLFSILLICLILLGAFFTVAQSSMIALSDNKLKKMCDEGQKKALRVQRITSRPKRFKGTAEFGLIACAILSAILAFWGFYPLLVQPFAAWLAPFGALLLAKILAAVIILFVVLVCVLIISRTIPYYLGCSNPERYAFICAPLFRFFMVLFTPGVLLVGGISTAVAKLLGADPSKQSADVTEEEIRMMMDEGSEKGVIESAQVEMINNIFEFDDTTAADVMTHRTNIAAVPKTASISDVVSLSVEEGYSRIPVFDEDIDNIVGAVYVKDLLVLVTCESSDEFSIENFLRPVMYIPDSAKLPELFKQFTTKKAHLAVVVDEYGGTAGLLTMEDLLEAIVGNIQDEYDEEDDEIVKLDDRTFTFDGGVSLEDLSKALGVDFPEDEDDEYDTLSGLIIHHLERIPAPSEEISITINGVLFTVLLVEDRRIARVKAQLPEPKPEQTDESVD